MTDTPACKYSLPEFGIAILSFHFGSARSRSEVTCYGCTIVRLYTTFQNRPESPTQALSGARNLVVMARSISRIFKGRKRPADRANSKLPASLVMKRSADVRSPSAFSRLSNSVVPEDNSWIWIPVLAVKASSTGLMSRSERPEYMVSVSVADTDGTKVPLDMKRRRRVGRSDRHTISKEHTNDMEESLWN